jgi:hypothetical protein
MRKLLRSIARANMAGVKHLNKKLYNPAQRKGETDEDYKARCAKSKPKSLFALNWRKACTVKATDKAVKAIERSTREKTGLARFFQRMFNRQYGEARA